MKVDPEHSGSAGVFLRYWLKLLVPLMIFPTLLLFVIISIEIPIRLFLAVAPPGRSWVSILVWAWAIIWSPIGLWGVLKICRQLWIRL